MRLSTAVAWTAVGAATLGAATADAQTESFSLSGDRLAVYNLAGTVTVERGQGSSVEIELTAAGRDAGELRFETGEVCGANALRVLYPFDDIVYRDFRGNTRVDVSEDGTFYGQDSWHFRERWGCGDDRWDDWDDRIEIDDRGRGLEAWADIRIRVPEGKTLEIYLAAGEVVASGLNANVIVDVGAVEVEVTEVTGSVYVDVGSGSVDVSDVTGNVGIDTGSGSVDVFGIRGEALIVDTGSGSVDGGDIDVDEFLVDTGSGSVDFRRVASPDVLVDTGSGSVTLDLLDPIDELSIDTGSGGVDLTVPEPLNARVDIDTGSGGIDVDFPITVRNWERDEISGVIGDGSGRIMIDTGSGSVTIRRR